MSLPRVLRPFLTINGESIVELDYKALHPLLLYRRAGAIMPSDPYLVEPWKSQAMRNLGKRTFNRLLNRRETDSTKRLMLRAAAGDKEILGRVGFKQYLSALTRNLVGIEKWFGTGEGIRLQYEDSILALHVIKSMEEQDIVVLPIHDSFIVELQYERLLRLAMEKAFKDLYDIFPAIDRKAEPSLKHKRGAQ
ncbi:hypothetical protein [Sphingomonas sp. GB1N7]|uniref:hypothetical protein n=1 Tax=Parasphingomonas caseinilytica TaxID=3096158 RepID=UPI002FC82743